MVGAAEAAVSVGGVGAGVGTTLLIRQRFDRSGETTVMRPSVLWGLGTGALGLGAVSFLRSPGRMNAMWEFVEDYSEAAITAGVFSAFSPKGGGVSVPTI